MNLPKIYGPGAVMACSGLDSPTDYKHGLVGSLLSDKLGLLFYMTARRELAFKLNGKCRNIEYKAVTGDVLSADFSDWAGKPGGQFRLVFADAYTVAGYTGGGAIPYINAEPDAVLIDSQNGIFHEDPEASTVLLTRPCGDIMYFAFSTGTSLVEATKRARDGLGVDVDKLIRKRLSFFKGAGEGVYDPETYVKALSVLRVNVCSPEGKIGGGLWTTTNRVPHRNMWLWDSVMHAFGWQYHNPALAVRAIEAVLDTQREDGFIEHMTGPYDDEIIPNMNNTSPPVVTQPPILAWGLWNLYSRSGDKEVLSRNFERLERYLQWDLKNRDRNGNMLLEWHIEGDPICRSGESGADNSARFDAAIPLDAVDFSSFWALDAKALSLMAQELGMDKKMQHWSDLHGKMSDAVNAILWDEQDGIYYDRFMDGELTKFKAASCFFPMLAGIAPADRAKRLVHEHLLNPDEFNTVCPFPADAAGQPEYGTDMWRGGVWLIYNYMLIECLRRYGYQTEADSFAYKTLELVARWYHKDGVLYEFFDSMGQRSPAFLDRKGPSTPPYDLNRKFFCIRDYGWTASVYITLANELKKG